MMTGRIMSAAPPDNPQQEIPGVRKASPLAALATATLLLGAAACSSSGQASSLQTAAPSRPAARQPNVADVEFMSGMIHHHAQAIVMAGWSATHGANPQIQTLSERIVVSQRDE